MTENHVTAHDLQFCCKAFKTAVNGGSDSECYGELISPNYDVEERIWTGWTIGCHLPPIQYCPWCGTKVPRMEDLLHGREFQGWNWFRENDPQGYEKATQWLTDGDIA